MQRIVINRCFGGFGLSMAAVKRIAELQGQRVYFFESKYSDGKFSYVAVPKGRESRGSFYVSTTPTMTNSREQHWETPDRDNPLLVQVVEELGEKANGPHAELAIIEVPDGVKWQVEEYDGNEHIAEVHQTWC